MMSASHWPKSSPGMADSLLKPSPPTIILLHKTSVNPRMISIPAASALLMEDPHLSRPGAQVIISSPLERASVSYFIISWDTSFWNVHIMRPKFWWQPAVIKQCGYYASSPFQDFDILMVWCGTRNINSPVSFSHTSQLSNTSEGQHTKELRNQGEWSYRCFGRKTPVTASA